MSLKAKIEAVIYASEEPVTLVQLAGLLGVEAQGELDALAARQHQLHLAGADAAEEQSAGEVAPEGEVAPDHDAGEVVGACT